MRIAVIGAGAMGCLYAGYLSKHNEVTVVTHHPVSAEAIHITEKDGSEHVYHPAIVTSGQACGEPELVVLAVKSAFLEDALRQNAGLLGADTYVLSLQNGAGHEDGIRDFVEPGHILIGRTMDGSVLCGELRIRHTGAGMTYVAPLVPEQTEMARRTAAAFTEGGLPCEVTDTLPQIIWGKLMVNASSSVLSGLLQVRQGFVAENTEAWAVAEKLVRETCRTAAALGIPFDEEAEVERVRLNLVNNPNGYTSVYADLKAGRLTEVDFITGAVVRAAHRLGVEVPTHELMLQLMHAAEGAAVCFGRDR